MPAPATTSSALPGWLILMGALTAIGPFSIDLYLAGVSVHRRRAERWSGRRRTHHQPRTWWAWPRRSYSTAPCGGPLWTQAPLLVGLSLYVIASLGCALAVDIESLTAWRAVQALGGAAGIVIPAR